MSFALIGARISQALPKVAIKKKDERRDCDIRLCGGHVWGGGVHKEINNSNIKM